VRNIEGMLEVELVYPFVSVLQSEATCLARIVHSSASRLSITLVITTFFNGFLQFMHASFTPQVGQDSLFI
jgi:hypothetical protein